jgi:uncharacterized protein (TIGR02001 family)
VTVRAAFARAPGAARGSCALPRALVGLNLALLAFTPAAAQVAGSIALDSDYRLRGYSLTDDRPAFSAQLSYDDPSGIYLSLTGLTELGSPRRFLGGIGNIGYAKRLNSNVTLEAGVVRSQIRAAVPEALGFKYTEIYAGAYVGIVSGRIYYSPDWRTGHQQTLYGEIEAGFEPLANWRLSGHLGLLTHLDSSPYYRAGETQGDWRIAAARQLGRFELHAAISQGGPERRYGYLMHRKVALTVGGSVTF